MSFDIIVVNTNNFAISDFIPSKIKYDDILDFLKDNAKIINSAHRFTDKKKSRNKKVSQSETKKTGTHSGRRAKSAAKKTAPKSKPNFRKKSAAKRAPKSLGKRR